MPTIKELLSAKIDSEAAFNAIEFDNYLGDTSEYWYKQSGCPRSSGYSAVNLPWWLKREHFRIKHGVYAVSEALTKINQSWAAPYAVHISHDDDNMVAYTPSTEAGMADKQIKTTFGKFLRKTFITLTDAQIQEIEQSHRAELTASMDIATTREEIEYVYRNMAGDSACMRYSPERFGITNGVHPSAVYAAPGMGVAYVKVDGTVKSRALVWTNPEDANDKRYVRAYGDPVLKRLLAREGYALRDLAGARIAKIPRVSGRDKVTPDDRIYVAPYLDGVDGDQSKNDGTYVVVEGEYLRLLTKAQRDEMVNNLPYSNIQYVGQAKSTSAYVQLKDIPKAEFTSDMTGITYTGYQHKQETIWLAHAKRFGVCEGKELPAAYDSLRVLDPENEGKTTDAWYLPGTVSTFEHRHRTHIDTLEMRERLGYRALSETFYSGDLWTTSCTSSTTQGTVLTSDAVWVLPAEGSSHFVHHSLVKSMRKQGYVNAVSTDGQAAIISKARPSAHRSNTGTWFCSSVHGDRFVLTVEGVWVAKGSAQRFTIFGKTHYSSQTVGKKTDAGRSLQFVPPHIIVEAFKGNYMDIDRLTASVTPDTCVSTLVPPIVAHIKERLVMALQYQCGECLWGSMIDVDGSASIGQKNYGTHTWADYLRFAKTVSQVGLAAQPTHDADEMAFMCSLVEALDAYAAPFIEKLGALMQQQALEAAGQMRVEVAIAADKVREAAALEDAAQQPTHFHNYRFINQTVRITPADYCVISFDNCTA